MGKFWSLPLRRQLVIAILLLLVPVLVAAFWSGLVTFRERTDELADQSRIVATTTAAYINRDVTNFDRMAERLSKEPAVQALDSAALHDLLQRVAVGRPSILRLALADTSGRQVARIDASSEHLEGGHWAARVAATRSRVVEPLRVAGSLRYIVFGYPVTDPGGGHIA